MAYTYKYPRPSLAVDCAVFGIDDDDLKVLLIQRDLEPHQGQWALPGGFVQLDEDLNTAAARELGEETGLTKLYLEQLHTYGAVDRDPRGRVISVAYFALVRLDQHHVHAATDAREAAWFAVWDVPSLAFDHKTILEDALTRLKTKVRRQPIGFELLPTKFTLTQLQRMYEIVLERTLDKRNFRKKVVATGVLQELDEYQTDVSHRAARLYRFDKKKYRQLERSGIDFEV